MSTTTTAHENPAFLGPAAAQPPRVRFTHLLAGLPAVAAAGVMCYALSVGAGLPLVKLYQDEAEARWKRNDIEGALACARRLVDLKPDDPRMRLMVVTALERLGRLDQAESIARTIAPEDRLGVPEAHLWLANRVLTDPAKLRTKAAAAEGHLLRYLQAKPGASQARALLGKLYLLTNRPLDARPLLESEAGDHPDRLIDLARACRINGDEAEAVRRARSAIELARVKAEARPDDKFSRYYWGEACAFIGDYNEALRVYDQGFKLTHDPVYPKLMSGVCAAWADSLDKSSGKSVSASDRLKVLQDGLRFDGTNPDLLDKLATLMMSVKGKEADQARETLLAGLAEGRQPAITHFALGNDAWSRGKTDEARNHWEQAYRLDPTLAIAANNLAYLLAYREPVDLPRAKAVMDQAILQAPNDARLRGTYGQVLVKMGRWSEAVSVMEVALAAGQNSATLHEALAEAYRHLGMADMAAEHEKLAKP